MREIDEWLYENIPGLPSNGRFTTDPAAAIEVLKKCLESHDVFSFYKPISYDGYSIIATGNGYSKLNIGNEVNSAESTIELSICLLAKKLFTK